MLRKCITALVLFSLTAAAGFGQANLLRDYVGLISIHYHPDAVSYMGKFKEAFEKKGYTSAAKSIDNYLKGLSGSGFVYVAPDKTCYVLTNLHVVNQSDTLSITFEKTDGAKTTYDRLKVLFADEDKDLALLVFDAGVKPFTQGLSFSTSAAEEGSDVYAAGFPGLANTALWQFSKGTVSNAGVRLPKDSDSSETMGPYIQHTAQIDPGNSGGPLLVAAQGVPTGYAVVGINTLSARWRQATNYAIPADQVQAFIKTALGKEPVNEQNMVARRVDDFIKGLGANKAVYGHIANFLSTACTASNAEFAISELLDKAPRTVLNDIDSTFTNDPVDGMRAAVAWQIENSMRSKSGALKISLNSIMPNHKDGFDVSFNLNDTVVKSEWIKEYGVYRMDTFGDLVTGDKNLQNAKLDEKQKKREQDKALRTDYKFAIFAGYSYVFDYGSALNAGLRFSSPFTYGLDLYYGFDRKEYFQVGFNIGYAYAIRLDSFALTPFGELGAAYLSSKESKNKNDNSDDLGFGFDIGLTIKGGLMFTTAKVPGLFGRLFYQHTIPFMKDQNKAIGSHGLVGISAGYGF